MVTHKRLFSAFILAVLVLAAAVLAAAASSDPWRELPTSGDHVWTLAAAPEFASNRMLIVGTGTGLRRSYDAGRTWAGLSTLPTGYVGDAAKIVISPAYSQDRTIFLIAGIGSQGPDVVKRSTNGGWTFEQVWRGDAAYDLALSPDFVHDGTVFLATNQLPGQVLRSTDRGHTWQPLPDPVDMQPVMHLALSPAFAADHTLYAAGFGPLNRSTNGGATWQRLAAPGPNYGIALSKNFAVDGTLWVIYREIEASGVQPESSIARSTDRGATWQVVGAGLPGYYLTSYHNLAVDADNVLYVSLDDSPFAGGFPPRVYRSTDGGVRWAPQALLPGGVPVEEIVAADPLPYLYAVSDGTAYLYGETCIEALADGGFETDPERLGYSNVARAWDIPSTTWPAGFTQTPTQQGGWAMRSGLAAGNPNVYSYSSFNQRITIPADAVTAELTFYRYPTLGDTAAIGKDRVETPDLLDAGPEVDDYQYLLALFDDGSYQILRTWRSDARAWLATTVDLRGLAGRSFRLQFGTFNNGTGGVSAMVVDTASLRICGPAATSPFQRYLPLILRNDISPVTTPTPTPSVTPTRTATATSTPTPTQTATPTHIATPTPTTTVTPTPTATPTGTATFPAMARELIAAPGAPGPLYVLDNSNRLLVSNDRGQSWQNAPQGTPPGYGPRGLGIDYAHPQTLYLGTQAGLFRTNDQGQWQFVHTVRTHALSVEYNRPTTLWAAVSQPHDFGAGVLVIKSDDAGLIWRSASDDLGGWGASNPIVIDPNDPNTLFVMTFTKYGGGLLWRGVASGNWRSLPTPAGSYQINGGLAYDGGIHGLYLGGRNPGILWRSTNPGAPNPNDVQWQVVHDFGPNKAVQPLAIGWGPAGAAIYINLTDMTDWTTQLLRSDDGGSTWTVLALPPGLPPPPQNQYQLVVNGYPATRLIADYRTLDRYATSFAGLHRRVGYNDWIQVSNTATYPGFVFSPANSAIIWQGLRPPCLMGGPDEPMHKSVDGGQTWTAVPAGVNLHPVTAHPTNANKVYAMGCDGPYLTVDGGATWQRQNASLWGLYEVSDLAPVDPAWSTVFAGGVSEGGGGMVARSTDGGATWQQVTPLAADIWWVTDVWVDPTNAARVYFTEPNGFWRSVDGGVTWQRFTTGLEDVVWVPGRDVYGLLEVVSRLDDPSRLYLGTAAGLYEGFDYGQTWQKVAGYTWDDLAVDGLVADGANGIWLNSPDGAYYLYRGYATPTPTAGATVAATPTATSTPTPTPTATPQLPAGCHQGLVNGDFEHTTGWIIRSNPALAEYVTSPVHTGQRSMRTGIAAGGANVESYSPVEQAVAIPAGYQAGLTFYRYAVWGDGLAGQESAPPPEVSQLPKTLEALERTPLGADFFYVIAIRPDNSIVWLLTERVDDPTWRQGYADLSALSGQTLRLQFGTYNNGTGGVSRTFVDDASLVVCLPAVTPTHTPTPTATPTSTPTPPPGLITTATPGPMPTPAWMGAVTLPAGSHPNGLAVSADGYHLYVAFHGVNHTGHTLGVMFAPRMTLDAQIDLGPGALGPNQVAVLPASGRVVVTNRQTANASVVDPAAGTVVGTIPAGQLPNGVVTAGSLGYIANYGSNSVTAFNPTTLSVVGTLGNVGQEPALLAADPISGDAFVTAHGSWEAFALRGTTVLGGWNGVPSPYGISYDPASRRLYVANRGGSHTITVIDVYLDQVVGTIAVGKEPYVLVVNPDSGHLFVACGDEVKVYDTLDWSLVTSFAVPAGAEEGIALGSRLDRVYVASGDGDAITVIQDQWPREAVFVSDRDGNAELYRMLPDGRRQTRLTFTGDAYENAPAGSPDGRWIAYERRGESGPTHLWLMSRDGHGAVALTDGPFDNVHPTWSGDSSKLAFASDRDGNWEIFVMDLATRGVTRLTHTAWNEWDPDWARVDDRIVFVSNQTSLNGEIFSMAADGSDVRRLTTNVNGDTQPSWGATWDRIAFYGSRPQGQALYTMREDGGDVALLVPQSLRPSSPAWAPVGDAILFSGYRPGSGYSEILRVQADGSGLVLLTENEVNFDWAPGWLGAW